jgi:hypothetical protein
MNIFVHDAAIEHGPTRPSIDALEETGTEA